MSYLFAGSLEHLMHDLFTPTHRALHQFGGFHDLRPISDEAWQDGLRERFAADECTVDDEALFRLIEYGELHARSTMLIAQKTHLTAVELNSRSVDLNLVEQGFLAALQSERVAHEQILERIRHLHKFGLVVAERLAENAPVYRQLPRGSVRRALETLRDAAIIESGGRGVWCFTNPLFRRYLLSVGPFD